jgi:hypothetical protein
MPKGVSMPESIEAPDWFAAAIAGLCARFIRTDRDAWGWAFLYPDESAWESPDCDVMSERFLRLAEAYSFAGFLVRAESHDDDRHWFTVVTEPGDPASGIAVDWTARQFYNAVWMAAPTDPALIACPLLFGWPGRYPLGTDAFESVNPLSYSIPKSFTRTRAAVAGLRPHDV